MLPAPGTNPEQVEYAMDWVRYLNDPPITEWGQKRAANGHPEPYGVTLFQIDNEPMNNGFTPESLCRDRERLRQPVAELAPKRASWPAGRSAPTIWTGARRSSTWPGATSTSWAVTTTSTSQRNFETGLRRIRDYLIKLRDYVRASKHPHIEIAVLEWSLQHTYDWRAGLHAAGSLMLYEELSPGLTMTCPALLMRNTTDDPKWTSFIYHDHVSWFPGAGYVVEKLFRDHYAERYLASAIGNVSRYP